LHGLDLSGAFYNKGTKPKVEITYCLLNFLNFI